LVHTQNKELKGEEKERDHDSENQKAKKLGLLNEGKFQLKD
jgi:hypothetical protein